MSVVIRCLLHKLPEQVFGVERFSFFLCVAIGWFAEDPFSGEVEEIGLYRQC